MKRRLAIFDIDGTIFRSSLVIELVNALIKKGIYPKSVEREIEKDYVLWVNRQGGYPEYVLKVVDIYKENIKGHSEKEMKKVISEVIASEKNKLYIFTRDLIKDLLKKKYFLLAISGSPSTIVSEFAKQLKFDHYFGTEYEVKKGIYTGRMVRNVFANKIVLLNNFTKEFNDLLDFSDSIGVGDTESDIPIFEFVKDPIAFNPNLGLAKYAQEKGWRIVVERKDSIFDIKKFKMVSSNSKA